MMHRLDGESQRRSQATHRLLHKRFSEAPMEAVLRAQNPVVALTYVSRVRAAGDDSPWACTFNWHE
jgi:hypothetical protein